MTKEEKCWNFAVVGCGSADMPRYLGLFGTYEEAAEYLRNMETIGWRRLAVFDAALKEVRGRESARAKEGATNS